MGNSDEMSILLPLTFAFWGKFSNTRSEGKSKAVPLYSRWSTTQQGPFQHSPHSWGHPSTAQSPGRPDALTQLVKCQQNPSSKGAASREVSWPQLSGSLRRLPVLGREEVPSQRKPQGTHHGAKFSKLSISGTQHLRGACITQKAASRPLQPQNGSNQGSICSPLTHSGTQ